MKEKILCISLVALYIFAFIGCKSDMYNEAINYYEDNDYEMALALFDELPENYKDSNRYVEEITECNEKYEKALELIEGKKYSEAKKILKELPEGIYLRDELLKNMDVLICLVKNEWQSEGYNYGWTYVDSYQLEVIGSSINLYVHELEYADGDYMGDYKDEIELYSLLNNEKVDVSSYDRGDFSIDYSRATSGSYIMYNSGIKVKFVTKE